MKPVHFTGIIIMLLVTVGSANADVILTEANGIYPGDVQVKVIYNAQNCTILFLDQSAGVNNPGIAGIAYNLNIDPQQIIGYKMNSDSGQVLYNADTKEQDGNKWMKKNDTSAEGSSGNLLRFYSGDIENTGRFQKIVVKLPIFDGNIPADSRNNQVGVQFVCDQFTAFIAGPGNGSSTPNNPALSLETMVLPKTYDCVGQKISYNYEVKNTGNVPITELTVQDDKIGTVSIPNAALEPGNTISCVAIYTIKQADLDEGSVTNAAYATGTFNGNKIQSNEATSVITADKPALTLEESILPATYDTAGQIITSTYKVTNSGNVKISGPITVTDNRIDNGIPFEISLNDLAVSEQVTLTKSYSITSDDLNAGSIICSAYATGTFNNKQVKSNYSTAEVTENKSDISGDEFTSQGNDLITNPDILTNHDTEPLDADTQIPEFPSIFLPVAAVLGLVFISQHKRKDK